MILPPVGELMRTAKAELDYTWVEKDKAKLRNCFTKTACFVRAGDAELRILEGRRRKHPEGRLNASTVFRKHLAESLRDTDIVGLPGDYIHLKHIYNWDELILSECSKLKVNVMHSPATTVVATIFYHAPELIGELVNGKRVLWVNYQAYRFPKLLMSPAFCTYYGLHDIESVFVNIPDGKGGWIFKDSMDQVLAYICDSAYKLVEEFDIAVIGAGAMANHACIYIRDVLKKSAIDVGAILSAMRGHASRGTFRRGGNSKCLVWRDSL